MQFVKTCHMTEYASPKTGEHPSVILQFSKLCLLWKIIIKG